MKTLLILAVMTFLAGSLFAAGPPEETANPGIVKTDPSTGADAAVETAENAGQPDTTEANPAPVEDQEEPAELSTQLSGLDTLDIVPTEMITQIGGGTRRVGLESSVFRREEPVVYEAAGRRDPCRALITDEKKEGQVETEFLRMEGASLKGVVWSDGQYLALITDKDGKSFVLREGDPVYQGRLISVTQSKAVFEVADFGDYQQITLKVRG